MKDRAVKRPPGRFRLCAVPERGLWTSLTRWSSNEVLYGWGYIAFQAICKGNRNYRLNMMYIEFQNGSTNPASVPSITRDQGLVYYQGLGSGGRDFLRVPLLGDPALGIETGYESYFTPGETGNLASFFAQTAGTLGVHGLAFSVGAESRVIGAALVAAPVAADYTQDIVFSRGYKTGAAQVQKAASQQIGVSWQLPFE